MGAAVAVLLLAWLSQPAVPVAEAGGAGELLFEDFKNVSSVARIEMAVFEEQKGDVSKIAVSRGRDGIWRLSSKGDYPADAATQLRNAVTLLFDLKKLSIESLKRGQHAEYGVVEPKSGEVKAGDEGVGRLVRFLDDSDKVLAELIVGKKVEAAGGSGGTGELFYVRVPGGEAVLTTRLEHDSAISADFTDWIETSLLNRAGWSFTASGLERFSMGGLLTRNVLGALRTNDFRFLQRTEGTPKWTGQGIKVASHEEINAATLDTLAGVFGSVKITDVVKAPPELAQLNVEALATRARVEPALSEALLKPEILRTKTQALINLLGGNGFLGQVGEDSELVWASGRWVLGMNDGVEIVLHFGERTRADEEAGQPRGKYLMARARFVADLIEKPKLPDAPEGTKPGSNLDKLKGAAARITPEHREAMEAYDKKVEQGKRTAQALDDRLKGWFFIVSEADYKKMRLRETDETMREQLVKNRTITAAHILVAHKGADPQSSRTMDEARKRIEEAHSKVSADGALFSQLALEYSDDMATRAKGGDLGSFDLPAISGRQGFTFARAAFALEVNGTSPVIEGQGGFQVIRRTK